MPGFELAKKALHVYEQNRKITSLILMNHGIFTFADNAKESYENMIFTVNKFEDYINKNRKNFFISNVNTSSVFMIRCFYHQLGDNYRCSFLLQKFTWKWRCLTNFRDRLPRYENICLARKTCNCTKLQ